MRQFVAVALIDFVEDGEVKRYGFSSTAYFLSTDGLEGGIWHTGLNPDIPLDIGISTEHDNSTPLQNFGAVRVADVGDADFPHIIDRFLSGDLSGQKAEVRRGYTDQTLSQMEIWYKSRSDKINYANRLLTITQRSRNDWLQATIADQVHADAPNKTLINRTVPVGIGEVFQSGGQVFDAPNLIYFLSRSMARLRGVSEGGAPTENFSELDWGAQLTSNPSRQPTFDFAGPVTANETETNVVNWTFDDWTADEPDGIDVYEIAGSADISENASGGAADITVTASTIGDSGWVNITEAQTLIVQQGGANWVANSGTVADAVASDDGNIATPELSFDGNFSDRIRWSTFDTTVPTDNIITGAEIELTHSGTDVEVFRLRALDSLGRIIADFDRGEISVPAVEAAETVGGTGDLGNQPERFTGEDVANGSSVEIMMRAIGASPSYALDMIRLKLHYGETITTLRLYTPTEDLVPGQRVRIRVDFESADLDVRWSTVAASGDPITSLLDPFSPDGVKLEGTGRIWRWIRADEAVWGMSFRGTGTVSLVKIDQIEDVTNRYSELVPWLVTEAGGNLEEVDLDSIDSHATAVGDPVLGWLFQADETMADALDLLTTDTLGGWWLPDRDGLLKVGLWEPVTGTPDWTPETERIDADNVSIKTYEASGRSRRAVGAKNWMPIEPANAAGITFEFSQSDRALISEQWRVIRRADPDNLNPWSS